jgi:hypothetical protein
LDRTRPAKTHFGKISLWMRSPSKHERDY